MGAARPSGAAHRTLEPHRALTMGPSGGAASRQRSARRRVAASPEEPPGSWQGGLRADGWLPASLVFGGPCGAGRWVSSAGPARPGVRWRSAGAVRGGRVAVVGVREVVGGSSGPRSGGAESRGSRAGASGGWAVGTPEGAPGHAVLRGRQSRSRRRSACSPPAFASGPARPSSVWQTRNRLRDGCVRDPGTGGQGRAAGCSGGGQAPPGSRRAPSDVRPPCRVPREQMSRERSESARAGNQDDRRSRRRFGPATVYRGPSAVGPTAPENGCASEVGSTRVTGSARGRRR
jgi:hypothetical protein